MTDFNTLFPFATPTRTNAEALIMDGHNVAGGDGGSDVPAWDGKAEIFDMKKLMDSAVDPLTGQLRDLKIDDRDLPLARNFMEFSTQFSTANPPYNRQMWMAGHLMGEWCPHCSDRKKFEDIFSVPIDADDPQELLHYMQPMVYGKCPKCGGRKHEFQARTDQYRMKPYNELVLVWGQRSGKSTVGMAVAIYLLHRWLKYPKLASVYRKGVQDYTPLTATFVSLTFVRAVSLLWQPFLNAMKTVSWFDEYHKLLDFYGQKYGTEFYRKKDLFIKYWHKNLHLYPSHPNSTILRGDTRFFAAIDELGLFPPPKGKNADDMDETSERANADEAHTSLINSLATVNGAVSALMKSGYDHTPPAMMMGLSSPKSEKDKVMRLYRESETSNTKLGLQMPTWEINPTLPFDSEYLTDKRNANPKHFMRDFGAQPPKVRSPYLEEGQYTGKNNPFVGKPNAFTLVYDYSVPGEMWGKIRAVWEPRTEPSIMTIDAGFNDNSFSIVSTHIDPKTGKTVCPAIIEIMPHDGRFINFEMVYQHVLLPFARMTNTQLVVADRWNSINFLHRMPTDIKNLATTTYSPRRPDFDLVSEMLTNRGLVLPTMPEKDQEHIIKHGVANFRADMVGKPIHHLFSQFTTVQDVYTGRPPEKGDDATDDTFRALVLGVACTHKPKTLELLKNPKVRYQDPAGNSGVVGVYVSRSGVRF